MLVFDIFYLVITRIRTGKSIGTLLRACGPLMVYTALFIQMGFGFEPLTLIMAVDFISDGLATGSKMLTLPLQILLVQRALKKDAGNKNAESDCTYRRRGLPLYWTRMR